MKKSLEPGLFLIKKENLRLKEENSKLKARVENIEINLRESKRGGCGQNPGHLNEVIYGIYSPTNYCSIKTV